MVEQILYWLVFSGKCVFQLKVFSKRHTLVTRLLHYGQSASVCNVLHALTVSIRMLMSADRSIYWSSTGALLVLNFLGNCVHEAINRGITVDMATVTLAVTNVVYVTINSYNGRNCYK